MKHLPNLLKQESSSAATLVHVLLRMYHDSRPEHQAARLQIAERLVPYVSFRSRVKDNLFIISQSGCWCPSRLQQVKGWQPKQEYSCLESCCRRNNWRLLSIWSTRCKFMSRASQTGYLCLTTVQPIPRHHISIGDGSALARHPCGNQASAQKLFRAGGICEAHRRDRGMINSILRYVVRDSIIYIPRSSRINAHRRTHPKLISIPRVTLICLTPDWRLAIESWRSNVRSHTR